MNAAHKIVVLVGSIFLAVGVFVGIIFAIVAEPGKFPLAMLSLPGSFLLIGGGMDIVVAILVHNKKMIEKGREVPCKDIWIHGEYFCQGEQYIYDGHNRALF